MNNYFNSFVIGIFNCIGTEYAKAYDVVVLVIGCEFRFFMGVSYGILI